TTNRKLPAEGDDPFPGYTESIESCRAEQHEGMPMTRTPNWPRKTHELHSHHFDSTIWNDFKFRDDDIIIATYAKSGTPWMQQIIAQMLMGPDPELEVAEMSPWLDLRVPPKEVKLP